MAIAIYPLWGALLGGLGATWFLHADRLNAFPTTAALLLLAWILLAALEERVFRIPLGRHIFGAAAVSLCWFPLLRYPDRARLVPVAIAAHVVSRAAPIALVWISRPARDGMALARSVNTFSAGVALASGTAAALVFGFRPAVVMLLIAYLILKTVRDWFYKRAGGVNGAALSFTQHTVELSTLLVAVFVR